MASKFFIKKGDTKPDLVALLRRGDGTYPDLGAGTTIKFTMANRYTGVIKVNEQDAEPNNESHMARYRWDITDTDATGVYDAEFVVVYAGGAEESFPNKGYITVEVGAGLE